MFPRIIAAVAALGALCAVAGPVAAESEARHARDVRWSFEGPFGTFDQGQLQRGYRVYREVCASCHSMSLMSFRNLGQPGGPFHDAAFANPNENPYVRALAAEAQVADVDNETGDAIQRPATSADRFPPPYANEAAARAGNGGALPPDLSVITKARGGGADYIYSLLVGYERPPAGLTVAAGQYYNPYMLGDLSSAWRGDRHEIPEGGFIAMPPPLTAGQVTYDDGTRPTVDQMARDVTAYLAWASEPRQVQRKSMGLAVMIYLLIFAAIVYASYRQIWRNVAH